MHYIHNYMINGKTEWYNRRDGSSTKFIFAGTMWSPEDILNRVTVDRESLSEVAKSKNFNMHGRQRTVQQYL